MPDLSTIIQVVSLPIALVALIISIGSFYYDRKPRIHTTSKNIGVNYRVPADYEFTIKNVSQNPAKDILVSVKLIHNEKAHDIGEYKRDYLNPEEEEVIRDISERINSKLEDLKLLIRTDSISPEELEFGTTEHVIEVLEKLYEENESQIICLYRIDNDFKINIEFKITCKADILISMRDKFRYNFEVSFNKRDLDDLNINEQDAAIAISYYYENNFFFVMKPSTGKWK